MSRLLFDLFNGNLEPHSKVDDNDPRCKNLKMLIERHYDSLDKKLDKDEMETFKKYDECVSEYEYLITERAFCDGFCLGVRLVAEAMCFSEKQISS